MKIKENMFGFTVEVKEFDITPKRPVPPKGYIEYNFNRANAQAGKCPNCGDEKPGTCFGAGAFFQDRDVQNLSRAMDKLAKRGQGSSNDLFAITLNPEVDSYQNMLKGHPSRYGKGELMCCGAKMWHDFYEESQKFYYKPTAKNNSTLFEFL